MNRSPAEPVESAHVAVLGLGYVGCVTAACLAQIGHRVTGIDRDGHKVQAVTNGQAPFYEPGLEEIVRETVAAGRLSASTSISDVLPQADVALICVGTPSEKNGNLGLEQLRRVVKEIASSLDQQQRRKPLVVAIRSTVYPGTCEEVVMEELRGRAGVSVVANPEFLREGTAMRDFMQPSLLVVGGADSAAVARVAQLYAALPIEPCLVSLRTAEMIKYACNAFHAVKISFANEIGALATSLGIDGAEVMATLCRDAVLNISPAYLKPGFAFGGSCLPKDLRALVYRASRLDLKLPLLTSVLPSNEQHLERSIQAVMDLPARRLGVFGLAFKENTDDLRESPVVALLEHLIGKGRDVRVFDPQILPTRIYGSNQRYLLAAIPHIEKIFAPSLEEMLGWADSLIVAQKPTPEIAAIVRASGLPVLDLINSIPAANGIAQPATSA
ncbi:MAG TPA: nucleotide sugar dehydrogenase [Bryobacteraceae bacterium]|nr:nucleotide sugar dehydrogenase [Bryobacteraceae bacterium]